MKLIQIKWLMLGLAAMLLLSSCGSKRQASQLLNHQNLLNKIAMGDAGPEEKLDALVGSFTGMMHESLKIANPKKGVNYVTQFGNANTQSIDKIFKDVGEWQKGMSGIEKAGLFLRMTQKPYAKEVMELIPKFQRKYKQISFVAKMTKKLKSRVFGDGLNALGGKLLDKIGNE